MSEDTVTKNLELWQKLEHPDLTISPKAIKKFKGRGGFAGISTDPMVRLQMLTELWGPQGLEYEVNRGDAALPPGLQSAYADTNAVPSGGWGFVVVSSECLPPQDPKEHVIKVRLWYPWNGKMRFVEGIGCTEIDQLDCAKKSLTDAQSNAAKQLGVFAAVYMGRFDDDKYVNDVTKSQKRAKKGVDPEQAPSQEAVDALRGLLVLPPHPEGNAVTWESVKKAYAALGKGDKDAVVGEVKAFKKKLGVE